MHTKRSFQTNADINIALLLSRHLLQKIALALLLFGY
jgi:hypothetical protein